MGFVEIIRGLKRKSAWLEWMSTDTGKAATETLSLLSDCYSNISQPKSTKIKKRLEAGDTQEIDAIIRELIAHELLRRLQLKPVWSPSIDGLNPDLTFTSNSQKFLADVFLVNSPKKTINKKSDVLTVYWDKPQSPSESRSKKISEVIADKSNKYSRLEYPLVLFVFFGDNLGLDVQKVEAALYGMTLDEIREQKYPANKNYYPLHPNLAAVIACKWFDTSNLADEGRRLHCVVLHNWATKFQLPVEAFSNFGQVVWKTINETKNPQYIGNPNVVAKFQVENGLELKPYTQSEYW